MKIRTLLRLNALISIGTPMLVGAIIFISFQQFNHGLQENERVRAVRQTLGELDRSLIEMAVNGNHLSRNHWHQLQIRVVTQLDALQGNTPEKRASLERLQAIRRQLEASFSEYLAVPNRFDAQELLLLEISNRLQAMRAEIARLGNSINQDLSFAHHAAGIEIFTAVAVLTLLLAGLSLRSRIRLTRPLESLGEGLHRLGGGEPDYRFRFRESDELGDLARAFDALMDTRREAERALAASEIKYRSLVENLPQKIFLKNLDLTYVSCNAAFARELGIAPEAITGKSDFDLFPREEAETHRRGDRQILEAGSPVELEEPYRQGDRQIWINKIKTPVRDEQGNIIALLGVFWDVSEQREIKERLKRLVAILENTPDYVATADADGRITWMNPAGRQLLGLAAEQEVATLTVSDTHPAKVGPMILAEALPAAREHGLWRGENALLDRAGGREIPVLQVIIAHRDAAGHLLYYSTIARDLSERKAAEEKIRRLNRDLEQRVRQRTADLERTVRSLEEEVVERQQTERALRKSEDRYRTLVENVDLGITLVDADYRILMTNSAQGRLMKRPPHALVGKFCFREFEKRDTVCPHCPGALAMASGKPATIETRGVLDDGNTIEVLVRAFPVTENDGKVNGFIEVIEDITERKRSNAELAEQRRRLETLMDNLPGMAYRCRNDRDWTMEMVSGGSRHLTGYPPEQLVAGRTVSYGELIHPEDRDRVWAEVQEALAGDRPFTLEYRIRTAKGEQRTVQEQGSGIFDRNNTLQALEGFIMDVTEAERARRELAASERRYRSLYNTMQEGVALHEMVFDVGGSPCDYRLLDVNPAFEKILGLPREKVVGELASRVYQLNPPPFLDIYAGVARTGRAETFEESFAPLAKTFRISAISPGKNQFATIFEDITARKKAEQDLIASEERLRRAVLDAPFPIMIHAEDGEVQLVSRAWTELSGYRPADIPTVEHWLKRAYGRAWDRAHRRLKGSYDLAEKRRDGEFAITTADGGQRYWEISSAPLGRAADGRRLVISMAVDVTERKDTERALRRSEERFRKSFELGLIGMAISSPEKGWLEVNDRLCAMLGYTPAEMKARTWPEVTHPDDIAKDVGLFGRLLAGEVDEYTLEKRFLHKDGHIVHAFIAVNTVRHPDGRPDYFVALVQDITDRKEAESQLEQTVADLKRSNQELEQFAYVASHDLQEPLRMVASYVQLLARRYRGRLDDDAEEFIGYAVEGATRMQNLINDLLAFSRVGRQDQPFAAVDCEQVVSATLRALQRSIRASGAHITHDPLPTVLGNASQLSQVFQNLLSNALKFHGQRAPRIHVGVEAGEDEWLFRVEDNGIGIEEQYFNRLFVIFQRLHGKREYPGTGIGLAVTKKIVETHGGRIWLESIPGQGTTFYFTLKDALAKKN